MKVKTILFLFNLMERQRFVESCKHDDVFINYLNKYGEEILLIENCLPIQMVLLNGSEELLKYVLNTNIYNKECFKIFNSIKKMAIKKKSYSYIDGYSKEDLLGINYNIKDELLEKKKIFLKHNRELMSLTDYLDIFRNIDVNITEYILKERGFINNEFYNKIIDDGKEKLFMSEVLIQNYGIQILNHLTKNERDKIFKNDESGFLTGLCILLNNDNDFYEYVKNNNIEFTTILFEQIKEKIKSRSNIRYSYSKGKFEKIEKKWKEITIENNYKNLNEKIEVSENEIRKINKI